MEPLTTGHWINSSNDLKLGVYVVFVAFVVLVALLKFDQKQNRKEHVNADAFCHHLKATAGEDERDVRPCWRNGVHKPGGRRRHSDGK